MNIYKLLRLGLAAAVVTLLIGEAGNYFRIPGSTEIVLAALGAIGLLTHAIARTVDPKSPSGKRPPNNSREDTVEKP